MSVMKLAFQTMAGYVALVPNDLAIAGEVVLVRDVLAIHNVHPWILQGNYEKK